MRYTPVTRAVRDRGAGLVSICKQLHRAVCFSSTPHRHYRHVGDPIACGGGSCTVKVCVACTDWLPNWSVTCAVTVNVPSLSVVASAGGIVVVQPVPCAFTVAV